MPRVKSDDWTADRGAVSSQTGGLPATLTITGTAANATCKCGLRLLSALSVLLDAEENPGFTQEITWRQQSMSGTFTVRNGTLRLSGDAYFSNASANIVVEENGVLELVGTNMPLSKIASLEVKGRLYVGAGVTDLFAAGNKTQLKLHAGCTLESEAAVALAVDKLFLDGAQRMKGTYGAADLPQGIGMDENFTLTVATGDPPAPTRTAEWTGAAETDDLSTTLGNWKIGEEVPTELDLASGTLGATIGTAATATNLVPAESGLHLNSIIFDRPTNSMCGPFFLGAPGRTIVLDGSLMPPSGGKEQMSQLVLRGTITSPNGMDQGDAESNGKFTIFYRQADRGSAQSPANSIYGYKDAYGTPLILDGATVNKPCYLQAKGAGGETFHALPDTVNVFKQHVRFDAGGWLVISAGDGAEVGFEGGLNSGYRCVTRLPGTFRVSNKPVNFTSGLNLEGGTVVLDVADNIFGNTDSQNQGVRVGAGGAASQLVFQRSGCFKDNDKEQLNVIGTYKATLDFNVTTQRVSRFLATNSNKNSKLTGGYPAMLEVKGGTAWTSAKYVWQTMENSVQIAGGLGVHYLGNGPARSGAGIAAGADETFTLKGRDFASFGDLEVSGGTLELAADASWKNGTNFVARGTGVLKFSGARQVNSNFARAHFADAGAFELAGVQYVASAEVLAGDEWQEVPPGWYTAASTGIMANRVKGLGRLRVGEIGTILLIK